MRLLRNWRLRRTPFHRTYPSRSDFVMDHVDRRMAVDRERGFIYFRIPKAANSTICYRLARQKDPAIDNADDAKRSFMRGSDLTGDEVAHLEEHYFLFTFVRDPYARIASAYLDKVARLKGRQSAVLAGYQKRLSEPMTFLEFCRYLDENGLYADPHWFPQVAFVPLPVHQLDFVGRVERFESDYGALAESIHDGAADTLSDTWDPHRTQAQDQLTNVYCPESLDIVRRLYAVDFETFRYGDTPSWSAVGRDS